MQFAPVLCYNKSQARIVILISFFFDKEKVLTLVCRLARVAWESRLAQACLASVKFLR